MATSKATVVEPGTEGTRRWAVSLEVPLALAAVAWGVLVNANRLTDNSFLTHLATGRLILEQGSVPTTDPYSFTAAGTDWTVQSWLPSIVYAVAEQVGGVGGLRVLGAILGGACAWLIWRLSRPCTSLLPRLALVFGGLAVSAGLWGMRPYMVGLLGIGLVWLVADRDIPIWTLVPAFWIWANSHGTFPMGIGLLILLAAGTWLDGSHPGHELRALGASVVGTLTAVIGPLGLRALTFPLTALERQDSLRRIQEWQPAEFVSLGQRLYLLLAVVALVGIIRRPSWRLALPLVAFFAVGMLAARNLGPATMVLIPIAATCVGPIGELRTVDRSRGALAVAVLAAVVVVAGFAFAAQRPLNSVGGYPDRLVAMLGPDQRYAAPDFVGNFLTVMYGDDAAVFIDDRVDMYPPDVHQDAGRLNDATPDWWQVLERYDIDVVVWPRTRPLASVIAADDAWHIWYADDRWVAACRRLECPAPAI